MLILYSTIVIFAQRQTRRDRDETKHAGGGNDSQSLIVHVKQLEVVRGKISAYIVLLQCVFGVALPPFVQLAS